MPTFQYAYVAPGPAGTCGPAGVAPSVNLPGLPNPMPYTWAALANATLMVGVYPPGGMPLYEVTWRQSALRAGAYTAGGVLRGTPLSQRLDATELGGISYHIGMAMAVYASQQAGFPNPQHLSRFMASHPGAVNFGVNPLRPDIIFFNPAGPAVQIWEAKGRRGGGIPGLLAVAMNQANAVVNVTPPAGGPAVVPNGRAASVAQFHAASNTWRLHVTDPSGGTSSPPLPPRFRDSFYRSFYRPFVEMVLAPRLSPKRSMIFHKKTYAMARLDPVEMWMGIHRPVLDLLLHPALPPGQLAARIETVLQAGYSTNQPDVFVNSNGIVTVLDKKWNIQDSAS